MAQKIVILFASAIVLFASLFSRIIPHFATVSDKTGDDIHRSIDHYFRQVRSHVGRRVVSSSRNINQPRIVGGEEAPEGRFPYLVGLYRTQDHMLYCGGALIDHNVILTAAHCTHVEISSIVLDMHSKQSDASYEIFGAERIIRHPSFNPITLNADFALIRLNASSTHTPVQLNTRRDRPREYQTLHTVGWGMTERGYLSDVPREVDVEYMTNKQCIRKYDSKRITSYSLCASGPEKDACQGDSGGPLLRKGFNSSYDVLHGLVSWGIGCANSKFPGVYSRVSSVVDWIYDNTDLSADSYRAPATRPPTRTTKPTTTTSTTTTSTTTTSMTTTLIKTNAVDTVDPVTVPVAGGSNVTAEAEKDLEYVEDANHDATP